MLPRAQLERLLDWAWDQYDWLSEWQRVGLGVALTLLLASASMYCLGAASLVALSRQPDTASAEPVATATASVVLLPVATEVEPISPLLADRTPTLRPTVTPTVRGAVAATATPGRTATPTGPLLPSNAAVTTPTRTGGPAATATRSPTAAPARASTASPTASASAVTLPRALPWGDAPPPSPARTGGGVPASATPTRVPGR